jgi:hypothetical protein
MASHVQILRPLATAAKEERRERCLTCADAALRPNGSVFFRADDCAIDNRNFLAAYLLLRRS